MKQAETNIRLKYARPYIPNAVFYIPFAYYYAVRLGTLPKLFSWMLIYLMPTAFYSAVGYTGSWALFALNYGLILLAVFSIYECGYIANDTLSIRHEEQPAIRLYDYNFAHFERHKETIFCVRLFYTVLSMTILDLLNGGPGTNYTVGFSITLMFGLFACARPMVSLILGEEWLPCVPFIRIFALYYAMYPIHTANLNAIKAVGRSDVFLKLEIIKRILDFALVVVTLFISVKAMAFGLLAEGVICLFINSWPNRKLCGYTFIEQLRDILPSFILAAGMCAAVFALSLLHFGDLATLVMQVPFGAALYLAGSFLFKLEPFQYLLEVVKKFRHE